MDQQSSSIARVLKSSHFTVELPRLSHRFAAGHGPAMHLIATASKKCFSRRIERNGQHLTIVWQRCSDRASCVRVPKSRSVVVAPGQHVFAIRTKDCGANSVLVP